MDGLKVYKRLEDRVKTGDRDALLARWEFGHKLLVERGDAGRLPNGRVEELSNALDISRSEVNNRMLFAEQYSKSQIEAVLKYHGSWYAICMWGLGKRGQPGDEFTEDWTEEQARRALYDAAGAQMRMAGRVLTPGSEYEDDLKRIVADRCHLTTLTRERVRASFVIARDRLTWGIAALDCRLQDPTTPLSFDERGHVLYAEEGEPLVRIVYHHDQEKKISATT